MRTLLLILFFSASGASASPFTTHDDLVHDLAHFGAGTLCATGFELFAGVLPGPPMTPRTKFYGGIVSSLVLNLLYEFNTKKEPGIMAERVFFGTLGAGICNYRVHF